MKRCVVALALTIALGALAAPPSAAQARSSEKAVVAQTFSGTTATIEYYRPIAHGRTIFGDTGVVEWGRMWTLGANWATNIDVDHDIHVEGKLLPKGHYSLWAVVGRDTWTLSFHTRWHVFHTSHPDSTDEQLRLTLRPETTAPTEMLTFDFPELDGGATTLRFRWGTLALPIHLSAIAPPLKLLTDHAARARYLGHYEQTAPGHDGAPGLRIVLDITESGDTLRWHETENNATPLRELTLTPIGVDDQFTRAKRAADGQYWAVPNTVVFHVTNGKADGFEVQAEDGSVGSRGKRVP